MFLGRRKFSSKTVLCRFCKGDKSNNLVLDLMIISIIYKEFIDLIVQANDSTKLRIGTKRKWSDAER